jgi:hypothetical protein
MKHLMFVLALIVPMFAAENGTTESFPPGTSITLKASADGNPAPTFQWKKDGVAINGATSDTLNLVTGEQVVGSYVVTATNVVGSASSPAYVLSLQSAPSNVTITVTVNVSVSTPPVAPSSRTMPANSKK